MKIDKEKDRANTDEAIIRERNQIVKSNNYSGNQKEVYNLWTNVIVGTYVLSLSIYN